MVWIKTWDKPQRENSGNKIVNRLFELKIESDKHLVCAMQGNRPVISCKCHANLWYDVWSFNKLCFKVKLDEQNEATPHEVNFGQVFLK